jgi:hypothetical protein
MRTSAKLLASLAGALTALVVVAGAASAQSIVNPTVTPVENKSGWGPLGPFSLAWLTAIAAGVIALIIIVLYMRYAPRFAKDEGSAKVVRADRVLPGQEPPRRTVDLSQAVPVVTQPPAIPATVFAAPAASPSPAAAAAAPSPAAAAAAPSAAPAAAGPAPAAAAAPPATDEAPAEAPPAAAAQPADAPPAAAAQLAEAPPAAATAGPPAAPAAPASAEERPEVSLDQETYDKTLQELLAQGTDRRIAEGKARRTAMIVARQKAAGGA